MTRRDVLTGLAGASFALAQSPTPQAPVKLTGRMKQGVTRGVFGRGMPFEDMCREAARLGCQGFDLIGPAEWPILKKYGLTPSMYPPGPGGTTSAIPGSSPMSTLPNRGTIPFPLWIRQFISWTFRIN